MFSNNRKISNHQMVRLLILDVFTGATLFLPMALGKIAGGGGLIALLAGFLLTFADGALLSWSFKRSGNNYVLSPGQGWGGKALQWLYGLRCFSALIFLMGLYTSVLKETFLYMTPRWLIITGMVIVLIYGSSKGIEVRARTSEILFYIVLIPIVLIGLFSIPEGDYFQLLNLTGISTGGVLKGALVTWVLMAPMEWILYVAPAGKDGSLLKNFAWALGIGGGLVLLLYVLCICVLSVQGTSGEMWPTVILMQIVRIPGGFMSRQDGLMLSFWIFAMFISLSGALSHGASLWGFKPVRTKPWKVWLLGIGAGIFSWFLGLNRGFLNVYFWWMILSGIFLLWVFPWLKGIGARKAGALMVPLVLLLCLSGCENYVELENRAFVMSLGVDKGEDGDYKFTYTFPDLAALTGNGSETKYPVVRLEGDSLADCKEKYNSMSNKTLDYGQIKVLVLGSEMAKDAEGMKKLLKEIKGNPEFARTVLIAESLSTGEDILSLDEEVDGSIGIYLENIFRNNGEQLGIEPVILNDLIIRMEGADDEKEIPKLYIYEKRPRIMR